MVASASNAPYAVVVDDDFLIRMDASTILEEAGFRVLEAEDGEEAHELLRERHPDVVLLFTDVEMPGSMNGFALAQRVADSWPHIAIVVASGRVKPASGDMPEKAHFISKPFSADLVKAHLDEILPDGQKPEPLRSETL